MTVFSTNQFAGGMNNWIDPGLLENNMSPRLVNADVSTGKIVPVKATEMVIGTDPVEDLKHYGTRDRSVIKWYERTYWSNNGSTSEPYYGGHEEMLGVPYPAYGADKNVQVEAATPGSGETGMSGTFKYCVTFLNQSQFEGAPGAPDSYEVPLTLSSQVGKVTVSRSFGGTVDTGIYAARLYRTIDNGADFYLVGELAFGNSDTVVFRDDVPDGDAQMMNPLLSQEYYPPPDKGQFLCEFGGTFFVAVGDLLYFSVNGNPHAWPMQQFLAIDDPITGIVPEFQGVLVFTRGSVYRVTGAENPETVAKTFIPGSNGCKDWRSIGVLNNAPIWLSNDGICMWDGGSITIPSYRVMRTRFLTVRWAAVVKDCYYLFLDTGTIVYDLRNGGIFYTLGFTCDYAWYDDKDDKFYMQIINDTASTLYLFRYFGDEGRNTTFTYQTPDIGGGESGYKIYREMAVVCDGQCTVVFTVDGNDKGTVVLPPGRQRVKFPFSAVGRKLSLTITAMDTLREVTVIYE